MRSLFLVVFVACCSSLSAQEFISSDLVPRSAVKFSPLHLFNFYPTFQLAYEHQVASSLTVQGDVGYILNYGNYDPRYQDKEGVKIKLEARLYMEDATATNKIYYFGLEPYANFINFNRTESGPEECLDESCSNLFIRNYTYQVKAREKGFGFKVGKVRYYGKVMVDLSLGVMMRFIDYSNSMPELFPEEVREWDWETPNETDRTVPSPYFGARIGYRIK